MLRIPSAGTIVGKQEEEYVKQAVSLANDPVRFREFTDRFERKFAEFVGARYALSVSSGTAALHLAVLSLGIGKGDEVILPDMTFIACANAVSYTGARPVFADIDPFTWCLDYKSVDRRITRRTKAIMPVWMYGNSGDIQAMKEFDLPIIEDACPAVGSYFWTRHAGTIGDVGCFSFQGAKILATGEGGMLVTNNKDIYDRAKKLHSHGKGEGWNWDEFGYMYRFSNVQAALGLAQLERIEELIARKRTINGWYQQMLSDYELDVDGDGVVSNKWMTSILHKDAPRLMKHLDSKGIETRPFFPPISSLAPYKKVNGEVNNPVSYEIARFGINLPSASYLKVQDVEYVAREIRAYNPKSL